MSEKVLELVPANEQDLCQWCMYSVYSSDRTEFGCRQNWPEQRRAIPGLEGGSDYIMECEGYKDEQFLGGNHE